MPSRRRRLRTSQESWRRAARLGDCRRGGWASGGQRPLGRTWRQLLSARQREDLFAGECLALEQRTRDTVQQVHVLGEHPLGAIVRLGDDPLHLAVDELRGFLGHLAPMLNLAAEEELLLVVSDENRPDRV